MYKKTLVSLLMVLFTGTLILKGQPTGNSTVDLLMSAYSARMFTSDPVSDSDLDLILKCGLKAPSARNGQPWKFTVVRDNALVAGVISNATPGNVLILVSGPESSQQGMNSDFDYALATENMYIAAQALGLGARIYTGPVSSINSGKKQTLNIPDGYRVIAVLRVGHVSKDVDASSSASTRKTIEEVVNYR
ncbi:MAG: nitroreductase family protein [Bacteroidales bacterium]|nr:nitroreductase family protein [Bacteroidales bacterium]